MLVEDVWSTGGVSLHPESFVEVSVLAKLFIHLTLVPAYTCIAAYVLKCSHVPNIPRLLRRRYHNKETTK